MDQQPELCYDPGYAAGRTRSRTIPRVSCEPELKAAMYTWADTHFRRLENVLNGYREKCLQCFADGFRDGYFGRPRKRRA